MKPNALVQTRIDPEIRDKAAAVFAASGLTVSDAVRMLLTRTANEGVLPVGLFADSSAHDEWFRAKVREALESNEPDIDHEDVKVHFASKRASLLAKSGRSAA